MKKGIVFIFAIIILMNIFIFSSNATDNNLNWYCVRNKEHKQPQADSNMQFIEKYNGYYIDHLHDDKNPEKVVYLTFDAGYENGNIQRILNVLKEEDVKATFFILDNLLNKNADLINRMLKEGHTVANHTSSHADITKFSNIEDLKTELEGLETKFQNATGKSMPKYFRCPEGRFNEQSMRFLNELGYKTIFWSFAYADWDNNNQMTAEKAKEKILSNIHNGAVLLLHPTSKTNADIMKDVIIELKNQGYRFGSMDELTENN